jgi:hypothetical protein
MSKYILSAFIILLAASCAFAQQIDVLHQLWEKEFLPDLNEKIWVIDAGAADIDNDGYGEAYIVTSGSAATSTASKKNTIAVFDASGETVWRIGSDEKIHSAAVYDLNNDRKLEFILSTGDRLNKITRGHMRFINYDGNPSRKFSTTYIFSDIKVDDIEGDLSYEIIGASIKRAHVIRSHGERVWTYPPQGMGLFNNTVDSVRFADIDQDGRKDALLGSEFLYIISHDGLLMGYFDADSDSKPLDKGIRYLDSISITGNNYPDIILITSNWDLKVIQVDEVYRRGLVNELELSLAWNTRLGCEIKDIIKRNLDLDDFEEIIIACSDNTVYSLNNNGAVMLTCP